MAKTPNLPAVVHDHFRKANKLHGYVEKELGEARDHALETGQELEAAKKAIPPGSWEDECGRLFDGSPRTARFYMAFARDLGKLSKTAQSAVLMLEGTLQGAVKAVKEAAKPAKPKPTPPKPDAEPIDVDSEPVDDSSLLEPEVTRCPNCDSPCFDEDGDCLKCHEPNVVAAVSEPVCEPVDEPTEQTPDEPDAPESAGTQLREALLEVIGDWGECFPDAPNCLVGSVLETLAADWR